MQPDEGLAQDYLEAVNALWEAEQELAAATDEDDIEFWTQQKESSERGLDMQLAIQDFHRAEEAGPINWEHHRDLDERMASESLITVG